jgi:hypothetical protein
MNTSIFTALFLLGAAAVAWVAAGFFGSHALALTMTLLIASVYALGALELQRFRRDTAALVQALAAIPDALAQLSDWLPKVPAALQNPVRLRIEGERIALPGPGLTPYLVGLLVMLGMLGTFLGMVATLNGAVFALEGTSDLQAIRSAFAVPIKGLGLAFGTSVAGVATSAMLGLLSALCRRERLHAAQLLDSHIAGSLRSFSRAHQRQQTFQALQLQSQALPQVVDQLQAMMQQMQRMSQQHNANLLDQQERFHSQMKAVYTELAVAVDTSLHASLMHSAQRASDSMAPMLETALTNLAQNWSVAQMAHQAQQMAADQQRQTAWEATLGGMADTLNREWQRSSAQTLAQQQQICEALSHTASQVTSSVQQSTASTLAGITQLLKDSDALLRTRVSSEADWSAQHGARMDQMATVLQAELSALREAEAQRGQAAVEHLGDLQSALASHLSTLGNALEAPIGRLIETASEAPRAAAEVIGTLRQEISASVLRDNALLQERSRIMETLNALLASINHATVEQRAVIDSLVASSAVALQDAGGQFAAQVDAEAAKLSDIAAHVTSSAVEVSSLGQTFAFAVASFGEANEKLIANLQRIEGAMDKAMARSDDQLAYYVAQAREVIDLSTMSQKEIVEQLRQLAAKQALLAQEAA